MKNLINTERKTKNKCLCVIPARKGSRGLKNKNIRLLNKIPLIKYPYLIANKINFISDIALTSDSKKYLNLVKDERVIKILRPKSISTSNSRTFDVIKHTLYKIKKNYEYVILLEPTSPFTDYKEIETAFKILERKKNFFDFIVSTISVPKYHSNFALKMKNDRIYSRNYPKNVNRQNQKKEFFLSGNFYIGKTKKLLLNEGWISSKTLGFIIKKSLQTDIDDKLDLLFAETILKNGLFKKIK